MYVYSSGRCFRIASRLEDVSLDSNPTYICFGSRSGAHAGSNNSFIYPLEFAARGSDGRENATSFLHVRDASRSSAQYRCRRVEGDATFDPSPRCVTDLSTCSHWTNSERVYICATFHMSPPHDPPSFPHIPPSRSQPLHPATVPHLHLFICKEDARRRPQRPQCIRLERD